MNINQKRLVTAMMQASLILPLSIGLVACGGSDEGYSDPEFEKPPVVVDKNKPELRDKKGITVNLLTFSQNDQDGTPIAIDEISEIAILNVQPKDSINKSLNPENISFYRLPKSGDKFEGMPTQDNANGAILLDSPNDLYSAAGGVLSRSSNPMEIITTNKLTSSANSFLNGLEGRLGGAHDLRIKDTKNGFNANGATVTVTGTISRKDAQVGVDKYTMLNHKRMRDEMLSVQLSNEVWTKPKLSSNYGTSSAESKEITFAVTTWASKGVTYIWVAAYDSGMSKEVDSKFKRYNNASELLSALNPLDTGINGENPALRDTESKTEQVYFFPKNAAGAPADLVDKFSRIALKNLQGEIKVENISLFRMPIARNQPASVEMTRANTLGATLIDDPELSYSAAGHVIADNKRPEEIITASQLSDNGNSFLNKLKFHLGSDFDVAVGSPQISTGEEGAIVTLSGSIKRKGAAVGLNSFPVMQHKRMRDEMLFAQYGDRPVWTSPTLKSYQGIGQAESGELELRVTTWAYKGASYLWTSTYDKDMRNAVQSKYGRFDKGLDLSSAAFSLEKSECIDEDNKPVVNESNCKK